MTLADLQQVPELSGNPFITRCTACSWGCLRQLVLLISSSPVQMSLSVLESLWHCETSTCMDAQHEVNSQTSGGCQAAMQKSAANAAAHPYPLTAADIVLALQDFPNV